MQREVEELIRETLDCYADGAIEQGDLSALSLILEQCHLAVLERMFAIGETMPGSRTSPRRRDSHVFAVKQTQINETWDAAAIAART